MENGYSEKVADGSARRKRFADKVANGSASEVSKEN